MLEYRTVKKEASAEFVEKRSRFIGYIKPVRSREEADSFIADIRSKHWDATHNVYAYVLREGQIRRYSDDGEPQGTAGIPVLDVLLKEELCDCAVVATRYFGGILLGGGGLVRAYSHTSRIAVDAGGIVTMRLCSVLRINCDYGFYGKLAPLIADCGGSPGKSDFAENVTTVFSIPVENVGMFSKRLADASFGKVAFEVIGEEYAEA
ncbi:MAG: YigZ family protein [Clostridia bacterium]|nr:YigZ family protein [Clostridia bacterium]